MNLWLIAMEITFHYPPELMNLLVDTIPLLNKGKNDLFLFFRGAGVAESLMQAPLDAWRANKDSIRKHEIVRQILTNLNAKGEGALRERREVLRRVVEFDNFSACWDNDRLKAKGLIAEVRQLVNVKDSFTRMKEERDSERQQHIRAKDAEIAAIQKKKSAISGLTGELFGLFKETDTQKRGKALEGILNRLFAVYGIRVRDAFTVRGSGREGVIEQIDGVIELDSHLYFVEVKWWDTPVGAPEIAQHMMRVFMRAEARAIIISASDFTAPAVSACRDALSHKVVTLCTLQEIVTVLEQEREVGQFLRSKVQATIMDRDPFPHV
jgi:hypothetical protein